MLEPITVFDVARALQSDSLLRTQPVGDMVSREARILGIQSPNARVGAEPTFAVPIRGAVVVFLAGAENAGFVLDALLLHHRQALAASGVVLRDTGSALAYVAGVEIAGVDALSPPAKLTSVAVLVGLAIIYEKLKLAAAIRWAAVCSY